MALQRRIALICPRVPLPLCVTLFHQAFTRQPPACSMLEPYGPAGEGD